MSKRMTIAELAAQVAAQGAAVAAQGALLERIAAMLAGTPAATVATVAADTVPPADVPPAAVAEAVDPLPPPAAEAEEPAPVPPDGFVYLDAIGRKPTKAWVGLGGFRYYSTFKKAWTGGLFIASWNDGHNLPVWSWDKEGTRPYLQAGRFAVTRDGKPAQPPRLIAEASRFSKPTK